jgi:hypothetical protein
VDGELHFGARRCETGTAVYIPGRTLYAFGAGEQGCRFLNFRGAADYSFMNAEELLALGRAATASA